MSHGSHVNMSEDVVQYINVETNEERWGRSFGLKAIPAGKKLVRMNHWGKTEEIEGPTWIFSLFNRVHLLQLVTAGPKEYAECIPGPCQLFANPMEHEKIQVKRAVELRANEVLVVYSADTSNLSALKHGEPALTSRKIIQGPALYTPSSGAEYIHEFVWHGTPNGWSNITSSNQMENMLHVKVPGALRITKLRILPDQTYIDCPNVRTKDDAVIILRFMVFYQLMDIKTMIDTTNDPISDFVNSLTADAIEFAQKRTFEEFKRDVSLLNSLSAYPTLSSRCKRIGFELHNVVFRGYNSSERLQQMHNQAIEQRTSLALEQETEEQKQKLADFKLSKTRERVAQEIELEQQRINADIQNQTLKTKAEVEKLATLNAGKLERELKEHEQQLQIKEALISTELKQQQEWQKMGVDITQLLIAKEQKNVGKIIQIQNGSNPSSSSALSPQVKFELVDS